MKPHEDELAADILRGARAIAEFVLGDRGQRRKIYHLYATSRIPFFKIGSVTCLRRSEFRKWLEEQEQRHGGMRPKKGEKEEDDKEDE